MAGKVLVEGVRLHADMFALARWRVKCSQAATFVRLADAAVDRRSAKRRDVRLNWGKALDRSDRFLCECLVVDRSAGGVRLRLARGVLPPTRFHLYDDNDAAVYAAQIIWRRGAEIGCRISLSPMRGKSDVVRRMSGRCYAL